MTTEMTITAPTENNNVDDGLYCAIKTLKMLSETKEPFSKLVLRVKKYETSDEQLSENHKTRYRHLPYKYCRHYLKNQQGPDPGKR